MCLAPNLLNFIKKNFFFKSFIFYHPSSAIKLAANFSCCFLHLQLHKVCSSLTRPLKCNLPRQTFVWRVVARQMLFFLCSLLCQNKYILNCFLISKLKCKFVCLCMFCIYNFFIHFGNLRANYLNLLCLHQSSVLSFLDSEHLESRN